VKPRAEKRAQGQAVLLARLRTEKKTSHEKGASNHPLYRQRKKKHVTGMQEIFREERSRSHA
jgi:hypothetical protein